jgi:ERCC4-type nuclease
VNRIYVDTRERDPWTFKGRRVKLKRCKLDEADYSNGAGVLIERKSVSDLFHTLTRGEQRFRRELARMRAKGVRSRYIVIEGTPGSIRRGVWSSRANGGRVLAHLLRLCVEFRIAPIFCDNRTEAEIVAFTLLTGG